MNTLDLWRRQSFVWGQTDCIMATCNHVLAMTGIDPARPWRGTYDDAAGAAAIHRPYGGPLGLFKHGMALAGFETTDALEPGFPVVCDVAGHEIAGIYLGSRSAFMAERGCIEIRAKVLCAWQL